jgi:hypothetical protein
MNKLTRYRYQEGKASKQAQLVSLYYSFSVDTITNIMGKFGY